jgi:hypothetical protein
MTGVVQAVPVGESIADAQLLQLITLTALETEPFLHPGSRWLCMRPGAPDPSPAETGEVMNGHREWKLVLTETPSLRNLDAKPLT